MTDDLGDLLAPDERLPTVQDAIDHDMDILKERKRAFQLAFGESNPAGQAVLADLRAFCRADATCFHADPRIHAVLEGRREVWLRVQEYLSCSVEELFARKTGNRNVPRK